MQQFCSIPITQQYRHFTHLYYLDVCIITWEFRHMLHLFSFYFNRPFMSFTCFLLDFFSHFRYNNLPVYLTISAVIIIKTQFIEQRQLRFVIFVNQNVINLNYSLGTFNNLALFQLLICKHSYSLIS